MKNNFFVTTPIYYTNGIPHIWHCYSSLLADTIFKYKKLKWYNAKFSTWVDENSQKALDKAKENGMEIMPYLDMMAWKHKEIWDWLNLSYTDFIRTTDEKHHKLVREVLQKSFDNGDIYEWEYEGMYCVWCEAFKKDDDLIEKDWEKVCADHLTKPDVIKEKNYFFKLSKYQKFLEEFYENNPEFIVPADRFNEVKAFVKRWLEDFSISRETNTFWIPLPFDESQVTYVWYDALFNYKTVCEHEKENFWPPNLHIVWKDIIRFHWIYWPAMLKSAWYELPKNILTTWFFTVDWQKISKSLWNAIDPVEFCEKYNKDVLILYLLSAINIGQDWDFDTKKAIEIYNAKLANNLWNLLNRAVVLTLKLKLEDWKLSWTFDENLALELEKYEKSFEESMDKYNLKKALDESFAYLDKVNEYITKKEPWKDLKDENKRGDVKNILYTVSLSLKKVWINLSPFFEEKMTILLKTLWWWETLDVIITEKTPILFEKID